MRNIAIHQDSPTYDVKHLQNHQYLYNIYILYILYIIFAESLQSFSICMTRKHNNISFTIMLKGNKRAPIIVLLALSLKHEVFIQNCISCSYVNDRNPPTIKRMRDYSKRRNNNHHHGRTDLTVSKMLYNILYMQHSNTIIIIIIIIIIITEKRHTYVLQVLVFSIRLNTSILSLFNKNKHIEERY